MTQAETAVTDNENAITELTNQLVAAQAKQKIDKLDTEETYQEAVITGQNAQTTYNATVEDLKETLHEAEETKENGKNSYRPLKISSEVMVFSMPQKMV